MRMLKVLLTTHNVAYTTSIRELFSGVSIAIKDGDRIGLVGQNGVGKTTLLRLLAKEIEPDSGTVVINDSLGYVPQKPNPHHKTLSIQELLQEKEVSYEIFSDIYKKVFSSAVPKNDVLIGKMSGGEFTKAFIAIALTAKPRILLLDEPTNHLDQKSIKELELWLHTFSGAVLLVSHNRTFLDKVAKTIWEISDGRVEVYGVSYSDFLTQKKQNTVAKERLYEAKQKELKALERGEKLRDVKAQRAEGIRSKNKSEPSRSKSEENYFRNRSEKGLGKIKKKHDIKRQEIESSLDELHKINQKTINIPLSNQISGRRLIVEVNGLDVEVGGSVIVVGINLRIEYGDRITISGDNGVGKTLLVKKLITEIEDPANETSRVGADIKVAYIDQHYEIIDPQLSVLENIEDNMQVIDRELAYKQLGRFQFPDYYAHKKASELSGGETARLAFAITTVRPLDFLVLDEPTNNLDIETVDVILAALNNFKGALLVISHDTFLLDNLKLERNYAIRDGIFRTT